MLKTRLALIALSSVAAAFAVAPTAHAADDYFMKLDGVTGETTVGKATDAIAINSFSWGAENKTTIGSKSGGAGAGKASFNELEIEKNVDSTTPVLFDRLATGAPLKGMELAAVRAGAAGSSKMSSIYMRYCFQTVFVTAVRHTGGSGDDTINETVSLAFGAVSETYTKQGPNGAPAGNVFSSWNTMTNAASMIGVDGNNYCAKTNF